MLAINERSSLLCQIVLAEAYRSGVPYGTSTKDWFIVLPTNIRLGSTVTNTLAYCATIFLRS